MDITALETPNLLVHLAATFYMVGLIWFVQRVHWMVYRLGEPVAG